MSTRSKLRQRGARTVAIPIEAVFVPSREPVNVDMNDPAALYTYAATSTLPGAGRGLFARRLIGPDSPIDDGEYIGEYMGGENLTPEDFRRYMFATNPDRQTAYMISFQGVIRDGWDHEKKECTSMAPFGNDPCDDDLYNSKWEVRTKRKRKQLWIVAMDGKEGANILPNKEVMISYGESAFCKTSLPTDVMFKAVRHYWVHIDRSENGHWWKIPQARALFNTPYHTCAPMICRVLEKLSEAHLEKCSDARCDCGLSAHKIEKSKAVAPTNEQLKRTKKQGFDEVTQRASKGQRRGIHAHRSSGSNHRRQAECNGFPDSNNVRYATNVYIKQVTEPEGAGEGLFFKHDMKKGDIVGIYENYTGGERLTGGRIKSERHLSDYAIEHEGLVRDAWEPFGKETGSSPRLRE